MSNTREKGGFDEYFDLHVKKSSMSSRVLRWLYPDNKGCVDCIGTAIRVGGLSKKGVLSSLIRRGLVLFEPKTFDEFCCMKAVCGKANTRMYFLTQKGRWVAVCQHLDLSFLGLCILADAYVLHLKLERSGLPCFYIFPRVSNLFEDLYSSESLRYCFEQIKMKKLAYRYHKKGFRIFPRVLESLRYYHTDLLSLQSWMFENLAK